MPAYIANRELEGPLPPDRRAHLESCNAEALASLSEAVGHYFVQIEALEKLSVPTLFYAGDADIRHDGVKQAAGAVPAARFVSLPGLDHGPVFVRSDAVLPHVRQFLSNQTC
jgi:pimeloyl-ACP methyl ester carboxylesterase